MQGYRASILRFTDDGRPVFEADGLLVVGPSGKGARQVHAEGDHAALVAQFPCLAVEELRGHIIAPGFVDMQVHYPQTDVIGAPAAGLLPW
jgi:guanine deaminase